MFGLDASEMLLLVIVGIVVVGPKKLPQMMRTAGQWVAKLRKMSSSLRTQSGIDEILRIEGLEKEMRELRALTRLNVMDTLASVGERSLPVRAPRQLASSGGGGEAPATAAKPAAAKALPKPAKPAPKLDPYDPLAETSVETGSAETGTDASSEGDATSAKPAVKPPGAPPPGAIPRTKPRAPVVMVALPGEAPLLEREWPRDGCDAYDALPDDLDEQEAEAAAAEAAEAAAQAAAPSVEAAANGAEAEPTAAEASAGVVATTDAPAKPAASAEVT